MYSTNSSFDILRSFLTQDPSQEVWASILALLERWVDPVTLPLALDYAQQSLDRLWPDHLRVSPFPWDRVLGCDKLPVSWILARCVELSKCVSKTDPLHFAEIFAHEPEFAHICALNLSGISLQPQDLKTLFLSPVSQRLTSIDLSQCNLRDAEIQLLASSPHLPLLENLNLAHNNITITGLTFLNTSPHLQNLQNLNLASNSFRHRPLSKESLELASDTQHLISLDLSNNPLEHGVDLFSLSSFFVGLHKLNLSHNALQGISLAPLLSSPHLQNLQHLNLDNNLLGERGALALAACNQLANLRTLGLRTNEITARGARALLSAPWVRSVESLDLSHNELPVSSLFSTLSTDPFPNLHTLRISHNDAGPDIIRALAQGSFPYLISLDLAWTSIDDDTIRALAASPHAHSLRTLRIEGNPIDVQGILSMASSTYIHPELRKEWLQWAQGLVRMGRLHATAIEHLVEPHGT